MIVNLMWKEIQKKYIRKNGIKDNEKTLIQSFITESIIISAKEIDEVRMKFVFEFRGKEYRFILVGENSCEIKGEVFEDFGMKILKEIIPYLREYKQRYAKVVGI